MTSHSLVAKGVAIKGDLSQILEPSGQPLPQLETWG